MSNRPVSDRDSALEYLLGRINYERTLDIPYRSGALKLDRMRRLLECVGNPQRSLPAVHIAGTKGKGSTSAMLAEILRGSGLRTGLYTSPHLERIEERFVIDGQQISTAEFVELTETLRQAVDVLDSEFAPLAGEHAGATFFEITTALALLFFLRHKAQIVVLEVGLGGRLDSTNVCLPETCVITSISFDHMRQLGNTLAEIAREKAGIIKPGVPIVSGVTNAEPQAVIAAVAQEAGAPLIQAGRDFAGLPLEHGGGWFAAPGCETGCEHAVAYLEPAAAPRHWLGPLPVGLAGRRQLENAAVAVAAVQTLRRRGWQIPDAAVAAGLASARAPGRQEFFPADARSGRPDVLIDVAHNPASIAALADELRSRFAHRRKLLIFASSRDKDAAGMLEQLAPQVSAALLTQFVLNPRANSPAELAAKWPAGALVVPEQLPDPTAAWNRALLLAQPGDLLVIAGSFFLVAELRPLCTAAG